MNKKNEVVIQRDITDAVNSRVADLKNEGLELPANYSYSNALKSAFFALEKTETRNKQPVLQACTKESIANSLLDMVIQGLSPAKDQCYFIAYGDELQMQRSYFGTQAALKQLSSVKDIWSNVIFENDVFDMVIESGRTKFSKHETELGNRDNKILGAYSIIEQADGEKIMTVMTMKEIQTAWNQSKTSQGVHKKFPQEMSQRTVINRAAKNYINTSNDSDLLAQAINNTTENEYENDGPRDVTNDVREEIDENANKEVIDFEEPVQYKNQKGKVITGNEEVPMGYEEVHETEEASRTVTDAEEGNQGALFDSINETTKKTTGPELEF